ncbi:signal peptidase I [Ruminococcus albus]|uniref:Signal peptidase I n=2 Tax=Ruminococcus TaxID=1263 RepID=E9SG73_RUMAL|nr:signal peptidase I [Ruminococcus albus]EGC01877.1 signal peptidase I [Ruminococcus albus 8]MCC3352710.1 signal peptidase I [Ruminococcus albus 8]
MSDKVEKTNEEEQKINKVTEEEIEAVKKAEPDDIKAKEPLDIKNEILEWFESFVFAMLIVQLVFIFIFRIVMVDGRSMNNTLSDGDRLIMTHVNYTPERDDVVVVDSDAAGKILIKRVIGIEGDKIKIDYTNNHVYVNGQQISNEHIKEIMIDNGYFDRTYMTENGVYEYEVPENCVFVMGDNRNDSKDSRSIGYVPEESIMGKAVFRIFPLNQLGKVD